jgi:hypothetical protein
MYIVKTVSSHGVESCGFATGNPDSMETYCKKVLECVSGIQTIVVYVCEPTLRVNFLPRFGLRLWGPGMRLYKSIHTGLGHKVKR